MMHALTSYVTLLPLLAVALIAQVPSREQAASLAIRNVTVIPLAGIPATSAMTVLIRGDRIAAIGPSNEVAVPADVRMVAGTGKFLIPV